MEAKYLIQDGTHIVYVYTEVLARRTDMRVYEPDHKPVVSVAQAASTPVAETPADGHPAAKHDFLIAAIAHLKPADFTVSGAPKVEALEAVLNENVTAAERDAAWDVARA